MALEVSPWGVVQREVMECEGEIGQGVDDGRSRGSFWLGRGVYVIKRG